MKTRGILIHDGRRRVELGKLELPSLGPDDVLVQSKTIGICRSDIELLEGHLDGQLSIPYPVVPGHEWSGEVLEAGAAVTNLRPGDRVVGECVMAPNHWFGFTSNGAGSEEFVAPGRLLHRLPDTLSFGQGAMVEPFTIAYRAIVVSGGCDGGEVVAIVGAGMIGQCALAAARAMGATTVVLEPSQARRELASRMGADIVLDPTADNDLAEAVRQATESGGADLVIEASGTPQGLAATYRLARFAGRVTNIGICATEDVVAPIGLIQAKDLVVRGVTGSPGVWPRALRFIARHAVDLTPLVSATYSFAEAAKAFEASRDTARILKVHLRPDRTS